MASLYATITPHFTQDLLTPGLKVGYTDEGGVWQFVLPSLTLRLPLRAIEWKNMVGVTKTIDKLQLNFISNYEAESMMPLVCIYVVKCEDLDWYKSNVKQQLAQWIERMNQLKVEWMVLYVPLGTRIKAGGSRSTISNVYKKIFEKIRADFTPKKGNSMAGGSGGSAAADRICKIETLEGGSLVGAPGQHQQHESQWSDLLVRLKKCIMEAFEIKCFQYEEELRSLDTKRAMSGWNFGAFFVAKERLALMYQQAYLLDDGIRHLDELEAIFQSLNDADLGTFSTSKDIDSSAEIFRASPLALRMLDVQQQIGANNASPLVIRLYLFCRQIRMLYLMGNFAQLTTRATAFISSFCQALRESQHKAPGVMWYQPSQWAVGACLEIAYACELSWSGHDYEVSSASVSESASQALSPEKMSRHLGELLYLARRIITATLRLPEAVDLLPKSSGVQGEEATVISLDSDAWYMWLSKAFQSATGIELQRCLWEVSHLASLHFSRAGRHRFAVFLGRECARYHFRHREFESASRLFRSHARQCEEDKWWMLSSESVRCICRCEVSLGRSAQAVAACFNLLQIAQEAKIDVGHDFLAEVMEILTHHVGETQSNESINRVGMGQLIQSSLSVETLQLGSKSLEHGEVRLNVCLTNRFPAGVHLERMRAIFVWEQLPPSSQSERASEEGDRMMAPRKDSDRLHSVVLDAGECAVIVGGQTQPTVVINESGRATSNGSDKIVNGDSQPIVDEAECSEGKELVMEEANVYLYEKASANLVFLSTNVPIGSYHCARLECVIAGNSFPLATEDMLKSTRFQMLPRESTLQISIQAPPILVPDSLEEAFLVIETQRDLVTLGLLDISIGGTCVEYVRLESAEIVAGNAVNNTGTLSPKRRKSLDVNDSGTARDGVLSCAVGEHKPGEVIRCRVLLRVLPSRLHAPERDHLPELTLKAVFRYRHGHTGECTTDVRRTHMVIPVTAPVLSHVRLKCSNQRIFAGVTLTCNSVASVRLQDMKLSCSIDVEKSGVETGWRVVHDPNSHLLGCVLAPDQTVHLAFVLETKAVFAQAQVATGTLTLALDRGGIPANAFTSSWPAKWIVPIDCSAAVGSTFQITMTPQQTDGIRVGDCVDFDIHIQCTGAPAQPTSKNLLLCVTEGTEQDWLVLGKHKQLVRAPPTDPASPTATEDIPPDLHAHIRLVATRVGRLQFPRFRLLLDGAPLPSARVFQPHATLQLRVDRT